MMYEIIGIKNNKLYRLLNIEDNSMICVPRDKCIELAKEGKLTNAKYVTGDKLQGVGGANLRLLNNPNYLKSVQRKVNLDRETESKLDKTLVADALSSWVYEQESADMKKYYDSLARPLKDGSIIYRGRLLHNSMLKEGAKLYLNYGLVSWTTKITVAKNFADTHMEHAEEERFDLQADLSEYVKVILCLKSINGSITGINVVDSIAKLNGLIDEEVTDLANDEAEVLLGSKMQPELTIVKIEKCNKEYYKLYCNITN